MPAFPRKVSALATLALAGGLSGCAATADVSYGEYQFGPGYETARGYQGRVYGDTQSGLGSQTCRVVVRRQVDPSGRTVSREETVCDAL